MRKDRVLFLAVGLAALGLTSCGQKSAITQEELIRRTQQLFDSVCVGDQTPWKKYFAEDCMYFDEKGRNMDKAALVADVSPLPAGYSGSIGIGKVQSYMKDGVAILSYDLDEKETIYGQNMTARYHGTDTWIRRNGEWQIIAGQMLRYYEDPAPGKTDSALYVEYVGTYQLAPGITLLISDEGKQLYRQRAERPKELLIPETADLFFRKGVEGRLLFRRDERRRVDALVDRRNNEDVVWKRVR